MITIHTLEQINDSDVLSVVFLKIMIVIDLNPIENRTQRIKSLGAACYN